jgi:phosphate transport system substrate-binding protein
LFTEVYLVTNPSSPKAADAKEFVDFTQSAKGAAVLRSHSLLPYAEGSALVAMDSSRRSRILAAVGAHASAEPTQVASAAPVRPVAPAAVAAASRTAVAATPDLKNVTGAVVAAPELSSVKGVRGDAFTVADASSHGTSFAKVTSDAFVSFAKVNVVKTTAKASKAASVVEKKTESKKIASVAKPAASALTYRVGAGETLYSIARKHGVDVAQIRTWNHLKDNTVRTGQVLRIESR